MMESEEAISVMDSFGDRIDQAGAADAGSLVLASS